MLTSRTETSSVELSGTASHRRYSRQYGSYVYGTGVLSGSIQESEELELSASAHYRHEINADVVDDVAAAIDPKSVRQSFGADAAATWRASERSVFTPSMSVERVSFEDSNRLQSYDRVGGSLGYNRQLNEYTSAGANFGTELYRHQNAADANVLSATATIQHKLSPTMEIEGALGVESVGGNHEGQLSDSSDRQVFLTGNGSLCRRGEWTNLCLTSAISSQPSGVGSLERRLSGGVSYSLRMGESSNLGLSANYQRSSSVNDLIDEPLTYMHARAAFDRKLSDALTVDTFLDYRRRAGIASAGAASAGINLRWKTGRN
ncbi:hypothetical protein [Sphingomonas hankyongi]|uniref:TonB-dependent receptor-like beta-barrel domain-containing protein n=1 Tax=Sphingomonas hankyongi TaxID=2908209 RepID=A0ABT0S3A5_9SPHN|nr:hypothetical protein [Sphingomonas hankyongi]MCL6730108.1 hypothetical protein [Sphingomonas hankyongi]